MRSESARPFGRRVTATSDPDYEISFMSSSLIRSIFAGAIAGSLSHLSDLCHSMSYAIVSIHDHLRFLPNVLPSQGMYLSRLKRYAKNSMPDKAVRAAETVKRARRANQSRKPPDDVARVCALVTNLVHYTLVRVQAICT